MLLASYADLKDLIESALLLSSDALHMNAGLALYFAGAWLIPGPKRHARALLLVLAVVVAGECLDLANRYEQGSTLTLYDLLHSAWDIANTVLWPSLLLATRRRRRRDVLSASSG